MGTATEALAEARQATSHLTYTLWVPMAAGAVIRWRQVLTERGLEQAPGTAAAVQHSSDGGVFVSGIAQTIR